MIRSATLLTLILLLLSVRHASADAYDDCEADCVSAQNQCVAGITLYDATGVQEATAACGAERAACRVKCHVIDDIGPEAYQEKLRKDAEEADRKRQEQEQENNGGIKTYNPGQ